MKRPHLLLGFCGVSLHRLSCHQAFQGILHGADFVRLDVQLQGEEKLQRGRLLGALLVNNRSVEKQRNQNVVKCHFQPDRTLKEE